MKIIIKILLLFLIVVPILVFTSITILSYCFDVNLTNEEKKQILITAEILTIVCLPATEISLENVEVEYIDGSFEIESFEI